MQSNISIIDKGFQLLSEHVSSRKEKNNIKNISAMQSVSQRNFYNMVSMFLFNVSAINEHYFNSM